MERSCRLKPLLKIRDESCASFTVFQNSHLVPQPDKKKEENLNQTLNSKETENKTQIRQDKTDINRERERRSRQRKIQGTLSSKTEETA